MTVELKRMYQRRGLEADLPSVPNDGELYIATDTKNVYFGMSGNLHKLINLNDVVDNLSTQNNNPLSARQGFILQGRVNSLESLLDIFKVELEQIIANQNQMISGLASQVTSVNNELTVINGKLDTKQNIIVIKDVTAPINTEVIWFNNSI